MSKRGFELFCNWADVTSDRTLDVLRADTKEVPV